jgi:hypothetical protein
VRKREQELQVQLKFEDGSGFVRGPAKTKLNSSLGVFAAAHLRRISTSLSKNKHTTIAYHHFNNLEKIYSHCDLKGCSSDQVCHISPITAASKLQAHWQPEIWPRLMLTISICLQSSSVPQSWVSHETAATSGLQLVQSAPTTARRGTYFPPKPQSRAAGSTRFTKHT